MKIAGIDYGIRSPSICIFEGTKFDIKRCKFYFLSQTKKNSKSFNNNQFVGELHVDKYSEVVSDIERYAEIADWAERKLVGVKEVFLEGYSFGSKGLVFNIGENTGILKYKLTLSQQKINLVEPKVLKKYVADNGNANKFLLEDIFIKETSYNIREILDLTKKQSSPISDIIDSYYLCKYGYEILKKNT